MGMKKRPTTTTRDEFDRQVNVYVERGYPALARVSPARFRRLFAGLLDVVVSAVGEHLSVRRTRIPFALVVTRGLISPEDRMPLLTLVGSSKPGIVDENHWSDDLQGLTPYAPIHSVGVPGTDVYAALDIDRGAAFRSEVPEAAVAQLARRRRTPLTIDEGISLATVCPEVLERNHCFMLAGSDRGDRRMPALWIADSAPKLGWCYKGNPHSWLGVASTARRLSA
jgi:hypothetical protein